MSPPPFHQTFRELHCRTDVSLAQLSRLTRRVDPAGRGLSGPTLSNLANANQQPSVGAMEILAAAFQLAGLTDVRPTDFAEYRLALVRRQLDERRPDGGLEAAWEFFERIEESVGPLHFDGPAGLQKRKLAA